MKMTGDLQMMKQINKFIVLDTIRDHSPISRAEISAQTGLNKATVSVLVNEWIEERLVSETGLGESSGGRKPMMLLFEQRAGFAIGIDLGVNYIHAVLTDFNGTIAKEKRVPLTAFSVGEVLGKVRKTALSLIKQTPPSPYGGIGIGIGVPGIVDRQGNLLSAPNLGWERIPLLEQLQDEFGVDVSIDNEANVGALGELQFGAGRSVSNLLYISVGVGIGAGIVLDGQIYRGGSGFAGEVGHMTLLEDGPLCRCGNKGCWETVASEQAFAQDAAAAAAWLGIGIANLINVFNPDLVIIGNRISTAGDQVLRDIHHTLNSRSLPFQRNHASVVLSRLGARSAPLGAASMAISRFFNVKLKQSQP